MAEGELEMSNYFNWLPWRVYYRRQRRLLDEYGNRIISAMIRQTMDTREWLGGELDQIREKVEAIHPAHIDMTQELADAILDRMRGPLTISTETAEWLKAIGGWQWTSPLRNGQFRINIYHDGTAELEMQDEKGARVWHGTLREP